MSTEQHCTCEHEESDGRTDVLLCRVHGQGHGVDWPDPEGFKRRTAEALHIVKTLNDGTGSTP